MSSVTYGATGVTPRTNVLAAREMLKTTMAVMVLDKTATVVRMPKNKTETISFRRPRVFDAVTAPLVEGVTPSATTFRFDDISVGLKQYGQVVTWTDKVEDLHEDQVANIVSGLIGDNIGRTTEALNWGVVCGGTNVFYANGSARGDVNTQVSLSKQRAVVRALRAQKAKMITRAIAPSMEYGTRAVEPGYIAIAHTDLDSDIRNLPGFVEVQRYGSRTPICAEEIGSVETVRYITSPDLAPFVSAGDTPTGVVSGNGTDADVYPIVFFGMDSWATVSLQGHGSIEPSIIPAGQKTKDDPLGQRGVVGWKMWHAALITNQLWMARLEVAATAL